LAHTSTSPERWLDDHGDALLGYACARVRDRDAAEDLVQETLLAAWRARASFAGKSSERTWLIGILKHKLADHWRRLAREPRGAAALETDAADGALIDALFDDARRGHWRVPPGVAASRAPAAARVPGTEVVSVGASGVASPCAVARR
jgi:RNA polymerase sigma-70 factor (ECF subfamily)